MKTIAAALLAFLLGFTTSAVTGSTALAPIHLQAGQQITIYADSPSPSPSASAGAYCTASASNYYAYGYNMSGNATGQAYASTWPSVWGYVLNGGGVRVYNFGANTYPVTTAGTYETAVPGEWVGYIGIIDQTRWYGYTAQVYFGPQDKPYNAAAAYATCSFVIS